VIVEEGVNLLVAGDLQKAGELETGVHLIRVRELGKKRWGKPLFVTVTPR
jgi:hypothetical protein